MSSKCEDTNEGLLKIEESFDAHLMRRDQLFRVACTAGFD